ncbi:MAG: segregation/condensation protein A [Elusimicrobia bacterium]|nr:segregation/condensation protein A [Elusimicrobiota bacterium]MBD3412595.1 segregation/condensation protein A [Elusimicrobiota bacterium]
MSYQLHLEQFEGPLDLLLHLIKKNNIDILDIPVADITKEYLGYIEIIKQLNLENIGEFLVMASTLIQIKTRSLLPEPEETGEQGPDPRADLVAKLLEYQKYKEAAKILATKYETQRDVFYREEPQFPKDDYILDVSIFDLLGAFKTILSRAKDEIKEILYEDIPIEVKIRDILSALERNEYIMFEDIFAKETRKAGFIAAFLAMLELIRTKQIVARQSQRFGDVRIYRGKQFGITGQEVSEESEQIEEEQHS